MPSSANFPQAASNPRSSLPIRAVGHIIGQNNRPIEGDYSSTRQWVLNYVIALTGLFLVLVYESAMTFVISARFCVPSRLCLRIVRAQPSDCSLPYPTYPTLRLVVVRSASLVQETLHSQFRSLEDFRSCHISDRDVCFVEGDSTPAFWVALTQDTYVNASDIPVCSGATNLSVTLMPKPTMEFLALFPPFLRAGPVDKASPRTLPASRRRIKRMSGLWRPSPIASVAF